MGGMSNSMVIGNIPDCLHKEPIIGMCVLTGNYRTDACAPVGVMVNAATGDCANVLSVNNPSNRWPGLTCTAN